MKVAIIGAGTSGLACAIELEKNGIYPVIFERNGFIGDNHPHVSAFMGLLSRPITNPVAYISDSLGIKLEPLHQFRKVIHYSPNNQVTVSGQLGHLMVRGDEEYSVKVQLSKQIKSKVQLNSYVQPEDLENEFDYVVVADGHWTTPKRYGIWQDIMKTWLKGGIFAGDFADDTLQMWLDNELTNGGYIYSSPYSKNKAVIAHVIRNIEHEELNEYWHRFLESRDILKKYTMLESWEIPHQTGFVTTNRVGKVYFIGAAGGAIEPFLGFGQFNAIFTGVMAGRSIAKGTDINKLLSSMRKKSQELYTLRQLLNTATNQQLDRLLTIMKFPGIGSLVYKTNIDIIKLLSIGINLVTHKNSKTVYSTKGGI